jgi:flagellar biosynthesis/type III secretory pathway protein FliH
VLRLEIPQDPTDESDREFLMSTAELYDYWKDRYRSEGVKEGHDLGVKEGQEQGVQSALRTVYTARFGPMPEDVAAIVAATRDGATLSRLLELIVTGTAEEVTRTVRGATSS